MRRITGSLTRRVGIVTGCVLLAMTVSVSAYATWSSLGFATGTAHGSTLSAPAAVNVAATSGPSVSLSWASAAPPAGGPVTYYVQRVDAAGTAAAACGTTPAAAVSALSCTDAVSTSGSYTYRVTALYYSWTATSAPSAAVQVYASAPTVQVTSPAGGRSVATRTPAISGTASDTSTVTVSVYAGSTVTGSPTQTLTAVPSGGSWTVTPGALPDGTYTVRASQTNPAGTGTSTVTFLVETTVPTVTVSSPASGSATNVAKPAFGGTASGSGAVTVTVYSGSTANGNPVQSMTATPSGGSWSVTAATALSDGTYTVLASQTNGAGTGSSAAVTFTVITANLTVTVNQASGQADPTRTSPITFTAVFNRAVTGFSGSAVVVTGSAGGKKTVTVTGSGTTYTVAVSGMTDGSVIASVPAGVVTDAAGNANLASTSTDNTVVYDATAPAAPRSLVYVENAGNGGNAIPDTLTGTAEAGSVITVTETASGRTSTYTTTTTGNGTWTVNVANLNGSKGASIAYSFSVTATDAAGNVSAAATLSGTDTN